MKKYDFGLNWSGTLKEDFVCFLQSECRKNKLSFIWISQDKAAQTARLVEQGKLRIKFLLDTEATYNKKGDFYSRICYGVKDKGGAVINDPDRTKTAIDKSVMHYELMNAGISVPVTVIIRKWYRYNHTLTAWEKKRLGIPFIIKPALGYGQLGVIRDAKGSIRELAVSRSFDKEDNFLVQEKIKPAQLAGRLAWFRVYSLFNSIIPCWWDDCTNIYEYVTRADFEKYNLYPLVKIVSKIAAITRMNWFSTEIAIDQKGRFLPIDYVNDQCSMTTRSESPNGVPDRIVKYTAVKMVAAARKYLNKVEFKRKYVILLKEARIQAEELGFAPGLLFNRT
jgi:hypothetical protein